MAGVSVEDFSAGQVIVGPPRTVTRDEIVAFAREFDPHPFHLDEAAARDTFVGELTASGWHTAALGMRMLQETAFRGGSSLGAPGIEELRWVRPVRPGDALRLHLTVEDTRVSASKPDRGFVRFALALRNGADETVMTQSFSAMFPRRGAEPPAPRPVAADAAGAGTHEPAIPAGEAEPVPFLGEAEIGRTRALGGYRFDAARITEFARAYDPQVFHLDAEAARHTHFGGLCASGWHTAAAFMRCLMATRARDDALTAARGTVPQSGPSPGFKNMRWLAPVYAGDTLHFSARLTDRRASASRPGWGLAFAHNTGVNQHGREVFSFDSAVFWQWAP